MELLAMEIHTEMANSAFVMDNKFVQVPLLRSFFSLKAVKTFLLALIMALY